VLGEIEVLVATSLKTAVFWRIGPCSLADLSEDYVNSVVIFN
jgi:hypothetical protein